MKLTGVWLAEIEEYMRSEQLKAAEAAENNRYPFKSFPDVDEWKLFYSPENYGKLTMFKFLCLVGDSPFGHTMFGINIFGIHATYACNCQGDSNPEAAASSDRYSSSRGMRMPSE